MELDEMKAAWKTLEHRLERDSALNLQLLRDRRLDKARSSLRPLFLGQLVQMGFGLLFVLLAAALWGTRPGSAALIAAGVAVHVYGVATIACAGVVLGGLWRIDYAAPVLAIQKQLARVRRRYLLSGWIAGLPWWCLWVAVVMVLAGLAGVDVYARAPVFVLVNLGIGVLSWVGTWAFHRWSRRPERAQLGERIDAAVAGGSLRRAGEQLDELERFERE